MRVVLGDQLSRGLSALSDLDPARDTVLLAEVMGECTYVPHHPRKIALVLAAMRRFSAALQAEGIRVRHVRLDDPANRGTLGAEVLRAVEEIRPARIAATEPGEWRVLQEMKTWRRTTGLPLEIRDDTRFLCSVADFARWAEGRRTLRMEDFYRQMRRQTGILMDGDVPAGGVWNLDAENRKRLPKDLAVPPPPSFPPDAETQAVLALVAERFGRNFGRLEGFDLPVTPAQAEAAFEAFLRERLPRFGDHQDAMAEGQPFLFHALVSTSLNLGLLDPLDLCRRAEAEWRQGRAPLNAVEGFIRQILGWREYVRGIYWTRMPGYGRLNALGADRALPAFYWTGESGMACMDQAIGQTRDLAYAHHIQRLMVTGNFALLAGIDPDAVDEWYLSVYADAFEWVELPNTRGMALHADGGVLGSKPYAASGKYIDRMGDHCRGCRHRVSESTGPDACPYNFLYWDFLARHRARFERNPRMSKMYGTLDRLAPEKVAAMRAQAEAYLDQVAPRRIPPTS